jgi:hypothetical protein
MNFCFFIICMIRVAPFRIILILLSQYNLLKITRHSAPKDTFYFFNDLLPYLSARYILLFQYLATISDLKIHFIVSMSCYPFCPQEYFIASMSFYPFCHKIHFVVSMSCYPICPQDTFYCFNILLPFQSARYILLFQCFATVSVRKIHFIVSMFCYRFSPQDTFYFFNILPPFLSARYILLFQCPATLSVTRYILLFQYFASVSVRKIHFIVSMSC